MATKGDFGSLTSSFVNCHGVAVVVGPDLVGELAHIVDPDALAGGFVARGGGCRQQRFEKLPLCRLHICGK